MKLCPRTAWTACVLFALISAPAFAQSQAPAAPVAANPDSRLDPLQPDFTLVALPTTLRLPKNRSAFRVTHRFTRSLGRGDLGDLLTDFLGFDSGAQIGLEFRYGLLPGTQIGVHRTSTREIQIFGQQNLMQQKPDGHPIGLDVFATFEGANNFRGSKASSLALLLSRKMGKYAAVYAEPIYVINSNFINIDPDNNTTMIGLGGRLRIRPTLYLVGEFTPRVAGYRPEGPDQGSFGFEIRSGGHTFQINISNAYGTEMRQLTQGAITNSWFIGFNISRKFF